jgi:hypothetical protein
MKMLGRSAERKFIGYSASIPGRTFVGELLCKGSHEDGCTILADEEGSAWLAENRVMS